MCGPEATARNEQGITGVQAATGWHMSGKNDPVNNPRDYAGHDLVELGAVKKGLGGEPAEKKLSSAPAVDKARHAPTLGTPPQKRKKTVLTSE